MVSDKTIAHRIAAETSSGYWSVGGFHFFNKVDCMRYASKIKDYKITFHYNDEFYSSLNYSVEPSESLEELYRQRAQQLRDKYDYLILSFSGGSDSYNVLDTFLKNNIHIDCIATSYPVKAIDKLLPYFDPSDRRAENIIFEFTEVALPKLRQVAKDHPEIEISILDYTDTAIDMLMHDKLNIMPVGGIGAAPGLAGHYLIGKKVLEYSEKGTAAYITGVDKPNASFNPNTGNMHTWFSDISLVLGNFTKEIYNGFRPKTEHFYYTPDFPKVWQKQCHILKRALRNVVTSEMKPENFNKIHMVNERGNYVFYSHSIFAKKILYSNWSENIFQAGKPTGYFFQEHSNWFLKSDLTTAREKDYHYKQVIDFLHGIDPHFINYDSNGKPLKFIDFFSQIYYF